MSGVCHKESTCEQRSVQEPVCSVDELCDRLQGDPSSADEALARPALESLGVRPGHAARFDSLAVSAGWVWGLDWQVQVGVRCVCGTVVMG